MKDNIRSQLDRTLEEIRSREISPELIENAARRVWARLTQAGSSDAALGAVDQTGEQTTGLIRGCRDFQSLIPAYVVRGLSEARALLLEDHTRTCVACRHALRQAYDRKEKAPAAERVLTRSQRGWKWALAAAGVAAILALVLVAVLEGLLPGLWTAKPVQATLVSVNGSLYAVSGHGARRLNRGARVEAGEEIRTAPDSTAEIRLATGSRIELGMRTEMAITRGWRGTVVHLDQGSIIVEATGRDSGHLTVATTDCVISDRGTIFAVSQGVKGSRVSVIQGLVQVKAVGQSQTIRAGGQLSIGRSLTRIPIRDQISWSPDASRYLALLGELAGMGRELEAMPGPPPRFISRLIQYVPENTVIYAAIPNLETMLKQVELLFQEHLSKSVLLNQWWQKQQASGSARSVEEVLKTVEECNGYLGNEIVLAAAERESSHRLEPVVLAQVEKAGFREFLAQQLSAIRGQNGQPRFRIMEDAKTLPIGPARPQQVFILLKNNVMAASSDADALRQVAKLIETGQSSGFSGTDFCSAIQQTYLTGASWVLAVNLEQIAGQFVHDKQKTGFEAKAGLANVKYLFAESKELGRKPENRLTVTFEGERRGVASWLAAPSPMGTLEFVSPDASFAFCLILKDPKTLVEEVINRSGKGDAEAQRALRAFETQTGVSIENDLAASLGGEVTVAQDGSLLPTPQWLVAMDVYDANRLEASVERLVTAFDEKSRGAEGSLRLTQQTTGGRVYHELHFEPAGQTVGQGRNGMPRVPDFYYTFSDGYLLLGPSQGELERAIQNRESGYSLTHSPEFQEHLPEDGGTYFSALLYEDWGKKLSQLVESLPAAGDEDSGGKAWLQEVTKNAPPVVIGAYGEPDEIMLVSNESPLGFGVNSILMTAGALLRRPAAGGAHGEP